MQWIETHEIYKIHEFIIILKKIGRREYEGVIYSVFPIQTVFRKAKKVHEGKFIFLEFQPIISEGMTELENHHL